MMSRWAINVAGMERSEYIYRVKSENFSRRLGCRREYNIREEMKEKEM
jgi:hypothetical protein